LGDMRCVRCDRRSMRGIIAESAKLLYGSP
jgi:hypothetical protein